MTPDAVIFRYLQLGSPRLADADAFCELLMADADLLSAWLRTLHLPASHARLRQSIAGIAPSEFGNLARRREAFVSGAAIQHLVRYFGVSIGARELADRIAVPVQTKPLEAPKYGVGGFGR